MVIYSKCERGDDRMSIEDVMKGWRDGLGADPSQKPDMSKYVSDMLLEEWSPVWKKFQPPMWRIFRWAYHIKKRLYTNVYPVKISSPCDYTPDAEISISFNGNKCVSEEVSKLADELREKFAAPDDIDNRYLGGEVFGGGPVTIQYDCGNDDMELKDPCKKCMSNRNNPNIIQGHLMTLDQIDEAQMQVCDILSMLQYPISGLPPTLKDSDFDSGMRMVYFIPGRETKYVKISE